MSSILGARRKPVRHATAAIANVFDPWSVGKACSLSHGRDHEYSGSLRARREPVCLQRELAPQRSVLFGHELGRRGWRDRVRKGEDTGIEGVGSECLEQGGCGCGLDEDLA